MIHVWTDGCCREILGLAVQASIVLPDGSTGRIGRPLGATTNNRAELLAVRIALEALAAHSHESLTIHTDSQNDWLGHRRLSRQCQRRSRARDSGLCAGICVGVVRQSARSQWRPQRGRRSSGPAGRRRRDRYAVGMPVWWSAREHIAREVEALLARTRQLRDPSPARAEQLLDEAFTVFRAPTTETRSCAATAVALGSAHEGDTHACDHCRLTIDDGCNAGCYGHCPIGLCHSRSDIGRCTRRRYIR